MYLILEQSWPSSTVLITVRKSCWVITVCLSKILMQVQLDMLFFTSPPKLWPRAAMHC